MKMNIVATTFISAAIATASPAMAGTTNAAAATPIVRKAAIEKVLLKRTGGFIRKRDAKDGKVIVFNAQSTVAKECFSNAVASVFKIARVDYETRDITDRADVSTAASLVAKYCAALGVFVVDDASLNAPMIVAPESRWAIVNVAVLKADAAKPAFVEARTGKEVARAAMFLCGGASSQAEESLMKAITKPADLDVFLSVNPPVDVISRMPKYLAGFGITANPMTTYLVACKEGWAPVPTNEFQKAIWDKVHALPTNPMKIEFDPKKGR